jgi:NAD(P) transhydrogenase
MADDLYDLVVIGSGPAGQKGAIAAAKLGKRVAIVDRKELLGGVCLHTGTIPSKTLREAILYLTGFRQRAFYGSDYAIKDRISMADLGFRVQTVLTGEMEVIRAQLRRNGVVTFTGAARFVDAGAVQVEGADGTSRLVRGEHFLIACGTRPAHAPDVPFDGETVVDSDQLLRMPRLPRQMIVVGAGVIGLEYASMLATLGIDVTVVDQRPSLLDFVDRELVESLSFVMRQLRATFRLAEKVGSVVRAADGRVIARLESGKEIRAESLLYSVGRQANGDLLNLEAAGLAADARGRVAVDERFATAVPHIAAAGDVIGFPALASTSMEQGRVAASHLFGSPVAFRPDHLPFGIYTIPEISMVGPTEEALTAAKVPYEVGRSRFRELAKGQMLGLEDGILKILFHRETREVLAVHAFGDSAAELIHVGQAVLALGGTIDYFRDSVFNYPTLAEAYKVAGLDGLNRLG